MKFEKGKSGNPRGRPKGAISIVKIIKEELRRRVQITEDGKEKKIQLAKVIAKKLIQKALQGDTKILVELLKYIEGSSIEVTAREPIVFKVVTSKENDSESDEGI